MILCSLIHAPLPHFYSGKSSESHAFGQKYRKIEFNIAQKTYLTAYLTGSGRINQLSLVHSVAFWKRYFCWTKNSEHLTSLSDRQPSSPGHYTTLIHLWEKMGSGDQPRRSHQLFWVSFIIEYWVERSYTGILSQSSEVRRWSTSLS